MEVSQADIDSAVDQLGPLQTREEITTWINKFMGWKRCSRLLTGRAVEA